MSICLYIYDWLKECYKKNSTYVPACVGWLLDISNFF